MATHTSERPGLKSKVAAKAAELVKDLGEVRAAVLSRDRQLTANEFARLEPRLFESWVIEKLAENECLLLSISQQFIELREEIKELRRSLPRPDKEKSKKK